MTFKRMTVLSMAMFFVLGVCAIAEEPSQVEKQHDKVSPSTSSSKIDSTSEQAATEPKTSPEKETVVETSEVIEASTAPTRVYSNRANRGYSVQQIRNMPMVARPDRPGHFIGNTVRAFYRGRRGR